MELDNNDDRFDNPEDDPRIFTILGIRQLDRNLNKSFTDAEWNDNINDSFTLLRMDFLVQKLEMAERVMSLSPPQNIQHHTVEDLTERTDRAIECLNWYKDDIEAFEHATLFGIIRQDELVGLRLQPLVQRVHRLMETFVLNDNFDEDEINFSVNDDNNNNNDDNNNDNDNNDSDDDMMDDNGNNEDREELILFDDMDKIYNAMGMTELGFLLCGPRRYHSVSSVDEIIRKTLQNDTGDYGFLTEDRILNCTYCDLFLSNLEPSRFQEAARIQRKTDVDLLLDREWLHLGLTGEQFSILFRLVKKDDFAARNRRAIQPFERVFEMDSIFFRMVRDTDMSIDMLYHMLTDIEILQDEFMVYIKNALR